MSISGGFTAIGRKPRLSTAEAMTPTKVRATFDEPMANTAALRDAATYEIAEDVGSTAVVVTGVTLEPVTDPTWVELSLDAELTIGTANYTLVLDDTPTDAAGNTLDPAHDTVVFSGARAPGALEHGDLAVSRLIAQFKGKPNIEAFLRALLGGYQSIEQAALDVNAFRSLETAFGKQLDRLGENLNFRRDGREDADYQLFLQAKAMVLGCKGRADELIRIIQFLDNGYAPSAIEYEQSFPAGFHIRCEVPVGEKPRGRVYATLIHEAKPRGVRGLVRFKETGDTEEFFGWKTNLLTLDLLPFASWKTTGDDTIADGRWAEAASGAFGEY